MLKNKDFWDEEKTRFVLLFTGVFLVSFLLLYMIGFVPDELSTSGGGVLNDLKLQTLEGTSGDAEAPSQQQTSSSNPAPIVKAEGEKPIHLTVPRVGIDIEVENPKSDDNAVLNEYLTRGAVHYPGSADLAVGNVFIFGHSSNWAVVQNKAYKALNGIDKLSRGDSIYVDSLGNRYVYLVTRVYQATASEAFVDLSSDKNMLTLSTCDIFGEKQNRFVAEAVFAEKIPLK